VTSARPRAGVNLLWLVPGVVGGSEEYATRLLRAVADAAPPDIEIVLFALPSFAVAHPGVAERFRTVVAPVHGRNKPLRVAAESTWLPWQLRRHRIDLVHHVGGRLPMVSPTPSVVTIHDLQPLDLPENFSPVKRRFLARALPRTMRRARLVLTPSADVRRRVIERFALDESRAVVVSAPIVPSAPPATDGAPPSLTHGDRYFLYPAITYAHKNHAVLVDAFAKVAAQHPDVRLVLTGGAGPCEPEVLAQIHRLDLTGRVTRTGRLPHDELDALVRHATALVFPSLYEGFGLPVVEAMAAGCPVIAADATALPEVLAGAGRLVAPDDIDGWSAAMEDELSADRAAEGERERAALDRYAPARSVDALLGAYRNALARAH
jgi:glycosyltransferase involved in cell wall biosynthesis